MLGLVAELLPVGLGVAINPVAVAVVLMLVGSPDRQRSGWAFVIGWVLGLTLLLVPAGVGLRVGYERGHAEHAQAFHVAWQVVGALLMVAGIVSLRPRPAGSQGLPQWAQGLERARPGKVLLLGAAVAAFSLRNILLVAGFISLVVQQGLQSPADLIAYALFLLLATLSLLVPVLMKRYGSEADRERLVRWQRWLASHMGQLTGFVMLLLGVRMAFGS